MHSRVDTLLLICITSAVSTRDELLATELVFSGILKDLSPAEAVALISALVFQEKSDVEPELPEKLSGAWKQLREIALDTANVGGGRGTGGEEETVQQSQIVNI
ncbi:hypothetical protein DUNSADRAFT_10368 [Dunaliella salina]|uniref:ATP-dependent RNA helicase Ski2/MTR4 C-terminal domain-containing protein n=1 Tax=Dunaliella salina TaxID=3046 RepID=A0ABQ7GFI7_DUNSA|nr:hypothetical protein DUNSADRAFT_10368 [Dunaliella salina]|eukprot:KAF5833365.1 hypothetical protein DUNSADRAFT_10368 [Dunaliella salina]